MIRKFETMFPRCLYVAKDEDYNSITTRFVLYSPINEEKIEYNEASFNQEMGGGTDACMFLVYDSIDCNYGYLIFLVKEKIDYGTCAHEATHICKHMEDYFGLERDSNEYRAYMTEWYSKKIAEVWINNSNNDDNIDTITTKAMINEFLKQSEKQLSEILEFLSKLKSE